jgi:hypothetical protein
MSYYDVISSLEPIMTSEKHCVPFINFYELLRIVPRDRKKNPWAEKKVWAVWALWALLAFLLVSL